MTRYFSDMATRSKFTPFAFYFRLFIIDRSFQGRKKQMLNSRASSSVFASIRFVLTDTAASYRLYASMFNAAVNLHMMNHLSALTLMLQCGAKLFKELRHIRQQNAAQALIITHFHCLDDAISILPRHATRFIAEIVSWQAGTTHMVAGG